MNLPGIDFVSLAAGYGVPGRRVSNAVEMADALEAAIDAGKPSLLEVEVEAADSGMFGPDLTRFVLDRVKARLQIWEIQHRGLLKPRPECALHEGAAVLILQAFETYEPY